MALAAADTYVVVLVLTDMMAGVGISIDALQRATPIISGFLLGYIAVLPLVGRLTDLVPRQRVLLGCLALFVLGSLATAHATELSVLVVGRLVQGIGGGGLVPATLAMVADLWPPGRRGTPLGIVGAVQELGSVLGPLLGAAIVAWSGWRAIFSLGAVLGVLLGLIVIVLAGGARVNPWRTLVLLLGLGAVFLAIDTPDALLTSVRWGGPFVPLTGHTATLLTPMGIAGVTLLAVWAAWTLRAAGPLLRQADLPGAFLLGSSLGFLVFAFASANPEQEVLGPGGWVLLMLAAACLGLYAWRHARAARPLIPRGTVTGVGGFALASSAIVGVALVAIVVDVPLLARLILGADETAAAMLLLRFLIAVPLGALLGGWSLTRVGPGIIGAAGLATVAATLFVMASWGSGSLVGSGATIVLALAGLGVGLVIAPVNDAMLAAAPTQAHGTASALVVLTRMVGMVVGLALLTGIGLRRYYSAVAALPDPTDSTALLDAAVLQVQSVFLGAGLVATVGAVLALRLGRRIQVPA